MQGLNLRLPICKNGTLPAELIWQRIAGDGLEPTTPGVWTPWAIQLLCPAVPDARIELTASWSQTRCSTKLSQSGICSRHAAAILQVTGLQEKRMLSSYAMALSAKRPHRGLNPESQPWQGCGITSYPMRPLYIPACAQVYIRKYIPAFFLQQSVSRMGRVRFELTMFLVWRFYRPLASAILHTYPKYVSTLYCNSDNQLPLLLHLLFSFTYLIC